MSSATSWILLWPLSKGIVYCVYTLVSSSVFSSRGHGLSKLLDVLKVLLPLSVCFNTSSWNVSLQFFRACVWYRHIVLIELGSNMRKNRYSVHAGTHSGIGCCASFSQSLPIYHVCMCFMYENREKFWEHLSVFSCTCENNAVLWPILYMRHISESVLLLF